MKKSSPLGTSLEELLEKAMGDGLVTNSSPREFSISTVSLFEKGVSLLKKGKYLLAAAHFLAVTLLEPQNVKAWNNLGIAYFHLKQTKEASQAFEKVLELDPQNRIAKTNLKILQNILIKEEGKNV